jgi:hypothetical protein
LSEADISVGRLFTRPQPFDRAVKESRANRSEIRSMPLEILHFPLVFFGGSTASERSQIATSTSAGVLLSGVQPVLTSCQFANHGYSLQLAVVQFVRLTRDCSPTTFNSVLPRLSIISRRSFCTPS